MIIDEKEIARLRALADAATPGPWEHERIEVGYANECSEILGPKRRTPDGLAIPCPARVGLVEDAAFIAAAREAVPALLDEVERLRLQLPNGMEHCTILFKQCSKGHGWLTATNWVQHGCPTCGIDEARAALARLADPPSEAEPQQTDAWWATVLGAEIRRNAGHVKERDEARAACAVMRASLTERDEARATCAVMRASLTECREWIGHKERQRQEWPGGRPHLPIEIRAVEALATDIGKREAEWIAKLEAVAMAAAQVCAWMLNGGPPARIEDLSAALDALEKTP